MKHCPHCGIRLEYHRESCPACDRSLAPDAAAHSRRFDGEANDEAAEPVVAIARFLNAAEAGFFAHTLLNAEEIPASLRAEDDFDAISGHWSVRYLLMVPERLAESAAAVLQSLVKRSETEDFLVAGNSSNELTQYGVETVPVARFAENANRIPHDEAGTIKWGPVMLTLAAGSLALWGLRELQRPPRVEPAGLKHGALWDDLSESSLPWEQRFPDGRHRELRFDKERNRAVIREYDADDRKISERDFGLPGEAVRAAE